MAIDRFFDKTVTSQRKASSTGNTVEAWVDVSTSVKCCIPPVGPGDSNAFSSDLIGLDITHNMFCWSTETITVGDKIVDGSDEYIVKVRPRKWGTFYHIYLSEVN